MKKQTIVLIIILMSLSLAGIIAVQAFWIRNAFDVKKEQFERKVNDALGSVVAQLEKNENIILVSQNIDLIGDQFNVRVNVMDSLKKFSYMFWDSLQEDHILTFDANNRKLEWLMQDMEDGNHISAYFDSAMSRYNYAFMSQHESGDIYVGNHGTSVVHGNGDEVVDLKKLTDSIQVVVNAATRINRRSDELKDIFSRMVIDVEELRPPIADRLEKDYLRSTLKKSLSDKGIYNDFEFAVVSGTGETLIPVRSAGFSDTDLETEFRVSLFPNDIFQKPEYLLLTFPGHNVHIFRSLFLLLLGSVFLTMVIITTFVVTIFVILQQKRISEIKSDFINNMTHEFKTPIATISLAVDSINNPKVLDTPEKIKYFTGIIREENRRMNTQVENVLQMALIDKKEFNFDVREINLHDIITRAVNNLRLQVEKKEGEVIMELRAGNPVVLCDEIHCYNIVTNLLDNANKYTQEKPLIRISTDNTAFGVKISVEDNGIGISREAQHRIFDKFYRIPTGDVHNVKGFGLGLSYVKAIVLAFGGEISVHSEPGRGSRFDIMLPFNDRDDGK